MKKINFITDVIGAGGTLIPQNQPIEVEDKDADAYIAMKIAELAPAVPKAATQPNPK